MNNKQPLPKKPLLIIIILSVLVLIGTASSIFLLYQYHTADSPASGNTSEMLNQIQEDVRHQAKEDFLLDMKRQLSNGTGILKLLREYYPDQIVYADSNRYIFADINRSLKMNRFDNGTFQKADSGEITYHEEGKMISHKGIDVSRYQGDIDFSKVRGAGAEYAMLRCGYRSYGSGLITEDAMFQTNIQNALSNQLDVGVYFFTQAISVQEAEEEADFVLSLIEPHKVTYPVVLDVEEIHNDTYRQQDLTTEELTNIVITFCERIKKAGYTPMIYGNLKCFAGMLDMSRLENYEKWFAFYDDAPYFPYEISMWQYTDSGSIDGISGNVDYNISFKKW